MTTWSRLYSRVFRDRGRLTTVSDLINIDDCVIVSHKQETITPLIESQKNGHENYVLIYEGYISNYLGVNIKKN